MTTCCTFSIMPPGIKLCAQQSFRTGNFRENVVNSVAQLSRHHTIMNSFQEGLLIRGGSWLGLLDHVHDGFWQSAKKNTQNARFEGEKERRKKPVECNEGKKSGGKGPDNAEDEEPGC